MKAWSAALVSLINSGAFFDGVTSPGQPFCAFNCYYFQMPTGEILTYTDANFPIAVPNNTIFDAPNVFAAGNIWTAGMVFSPFAIESKSQGHWKVGLDSDQWQVVAYPRPFDVITGAAFPDTIGNVPWLQAAAAGLLDSADIIIGRAFFSAMPSYAPSPPYPFPPYAGSLISTNSNTGNVQSYSQAGVPANVPGGSTGLNATGIDIDFNGNLFIASSGGGSISKLTPSGTLTTFASGLNTSLFGIRFDPFGNLFVADSADNQIYKITPGGVITTFLSGSLISTPKSIVCDAAGNIYISCGGTSQVVKATQGGLTSVYATGLDPVGTNSVGAVFDNAGNLYVCTTLGISIVPPGGGRARTFVNVGGAPSGLAIDQNSTLYLSDHSSDIVYAITLGGVISQFSPAVGSGAGIIALKYMPPASWIGPVGAGKGAVPVGIGIMFRGTLGTVNVTASMAQITVNDYKTCLTQQMPRNLYMGSCRNRFGDGRCTINLASFTNSGTASAASTRGQIIATANVPNPGGSGTYALGILKFTSGANAGLSQSVNTWDGGVTFGLLRPFPFNVAPGDTFTVSSGCNKSLANCKLYNNSANFRADPFTPAPELSIG